MNSNLNDRLFVKAIADVAKGMEIKTIAEFVEDEETIKVLKEYGINFVQGYAVGKPSPVLDNKDNRFAQA
jgi:EAL domain-containing protein (putative c-di-GMP-specific phosphodiesterase class I)